MILVRGGRGRWVWQVNDVREAKQENRGLKIPDGRGYVVEWEAASSVSIVVGNPAAVSLVVTVPRMVVGGTH